MSNTYRDLKRALGEVSKRVVEENLYTTNIELAKATQQAERVFNTIGPYHVKDRQGDIVNVTPWCLYRVNFMLRRSGIDWPLLPWEELLTWLYNNWERVLRALLTLLSLVIL